MGVVIEPIAHKAEVKQNELYNADVSCYNNNTGEYTMSYYTGDPEQNSKTYLESKARNLSRLLASFCFDLPIVAKILCITVYAKGS